MSDPVYYQATSIEAATLGTTVINKRATLVGIIVHGKTVTTLNDVKSLVLKNGETGDTLYEASFFQGPVQTASGSVDIENLPSTQVSFGGEGILFQDSVWFEFGDGPGSEEGVDNIVFFYI